MTKKPVSKLGVGLLAFWGLVGVVGYWNTVQKEARKEAAAEATVRKAEAKRQARAGYLAANPKVAATERAEQRRRAAQQQQKFRVAEEQDRQAERQVQLSEKQRGQRIEKYLKENFAGAAGFEPTWYLAVKRQYSFVDDRIKVHTNLNYVLSGDPLREEWERLARGTCMGVSGYIYDKASPDKHLKEVQVLSSDGRELASCP
jgi:hypothetical protein